MNEKMEHGGYGEITVLEGKDTSYSECRWGAVGAGTGRGEESHRQTPDCKRRRHHSG